MMDQQNYGDEIDGPVNPNGMFNGGNVEEDGQEEVDEYFDDAGDIGYLPADHVSYLFFSKNRLTNRFYFSP